MNYLSCYFAGGLDNQLFQAAHVVTQSKKQGPFIVNCSMFHKKSFEDCGGFDESLKGWEDYDFWIRMGLNGYEGKRISKPLFIYFHHEKDGTVSTIANNNQQELYNKIMKKNFNHELV